MSNWSKSLYLNQSVRIVDGRIFNKDFASKKEFEYYSDWQRNPPDISCLQQIKSSQDRVALTKSRSNIGSIDISKPLSTVLSSAVDKSQQHQEKNYW